MGLVDSEGYLEFGDLIKGVSTYCMYGLDEILRQLYLFADTHKLGVVTMQQVTDLFFILNPEVLEKGRMKSGLLAMEIPMDTMIPFERFKRLNAQVPSVMFAAMRLQRDLRGYFMGAEWWVQKMIKYEKVRKSVAGSKERTKQLIEMELKRFDLDQERLLRMDRRRRMIEAEPSALKRAMMSAMQTADEFS